MLDQIHTDIIARLAPDLSAQGLQTLEAYPELQRSVALPAVLLELSELAPDDFSDATVGFQARFTAYCIVDPIPDTADMDVRNLAAEVATRIIQEQDFGNAAVMERAEVLSIGPNEWKPELDGYLVWAVQFSLGVSVGEGYWRFDPAPGVAVTTITVGDCAIVHGENYAAPGEHTDAGGADTPLASIHETLPQA